MGKDIRRRQYSVLLVNDNGEWFERGQMGWYGMTSNEKPKADWDEEFKSYVQTLLDNEEHIKANNTGGHHYTNGVH